MVQPDEVDPYWKLTPEGFAMWPPRFRFTIRRMMVAVAVVALTLTYLGSGSTKLGCGSASVLLTFQVVDDRDGRPVAGASVKLFQEWPAPLTPNAITGADGSTQTVCKTGATWYSGPFFRKYRSLSFGDALLIEAKGYQSVQTLVREYVRDPVYHNSTVPPPIQVRLKCSVEG